MVATCLAHIASVDLDRLPRMADFARWITAGECELGLEPGQFLAIYEANREAATGAVVEDSPIGAAIQALMEERSHWKGTATELLQLLEHHYATLQQTKKRGWPSSGKGVTNALQRLAPHLRREGIEYEPQKREPGTGKRVITLKHVERVGENSSQSSQRHTGLGSPFKNNNLPRDETVTEPVTKRGAVTEQPSHRHTNRHSRRPHEDAACDERDKCDENFATARHEHNEGDGSWQKTL